VGFARNEGPAAAAVAIDWPAGLDVDAAAELFASRGLVTSRAAMAVYLRATGGTGAFVPGPHLLPAGASPRELRALLERSPDRRKVRVTLPEGFTRFDVAARLEKLEVAGAAAFLAATTDPALLEGLGLAPEAQSSVESVEGYLFPATYDLLLDEDPAALVTRLVGEADRRWRALVERHEGGLASLHSTLGWGRREVTILASIVEKEAQVDDERAIIASVFLNRLVDSGFRPKRLQSDPTAAYGCVAWPDEAPSCASFAGKPTPAINGDSKNRYSTYTRSGLPPGPIGNPGERSIEAVLAPAATRYLYFVASGRGRHTFSETLTLHNEAVRRTRTP
jgi:UPF0755 protein